MYSETWFSSSKMRATSSSTKTHMVSPLLALRSLMITSVTLVLRLTRLRGHCCAVTIPRQLHVWPYHDL
jgi:hypothetical protein